MAYPRPIQAMIDFFCILPGVGEKTAQRFTFHLLRQSPDKLAGFAQAILDLHSTLLTCRTCHDYAESNPCGMCGNAARDRSTLCVIAYSHDRAALERTGEFRGLYHVLGGNVNILEGITPDQLRIRQLVERITLPGNPIKEVILAFNPDLEGESSSLYLSKLLKQYPITITRLARGLPRGADIEYADDITLADAIKARREV